MIRTRSSLAAALVLTGALLAASACAGPAPEAAAPQTPTPLATSPTPTPSPTQSEEPVGDPTCETIIPATTVEDFESVGWTARSETFRIGEVEIPEGVQCVWGDFTTATDHVQIYGWAPISADEAVDAQNALVAQGWRREETPEGLIVTESAETTVATDDQGYGLTYLFGDGWVKYADTKQGLLLVTWG
jgi:hypothetical protein